MQLILWQGAARVNTPGKSRKVSTSGRVFLKAVMLT